jgi:hypothetical protein
MSYESKVQMTANQLTNVSFSEFVVFCSYVWNTNLGWTEEEIWSQIAKFESERTFTEDWSYCDSSLSFTPMGGWKWEYKTTSGTILRASQQCPLNAQEPLINCQVEIPAHRVGGTHSSYLEVALINLPYLSSEVYSRDCYNWEIKVNNMLTGTTLVERLQSRLEREIKKESKKVEAKVLAELETDSDEEFEDYEGDFDED